MEEKDLRILRLNELLSGTFGLELGELCMVV